MPLQSSRAQNNNIKPNVIIILTDDQGCGDLTCHGNTIIKTPNLDQLYNKGVRLANFHVDPVCAPKRAALMTGCYSHRAGVWNVVGTPSILPDGEVIMSDLFSTAEYRTALFGKWHLGDNYPYHPEDRGFQKVITMSGGVVGHTPDYWLNDYFDDHFRHNGCWEKFPGYCTDVWFDQAIDVMRKTADMPFFIYLPVNSPHTPLQVSSSYMKPYLGQSEKTQRFYGMISCIDENVGRLREELRKTGLEWRTILIFMTDNDGTVGVNLFNASVRGRKGSPYEGGHSVPCFIYWPGGWITGGHDLTPLLRNRAAPWEDRTLFIEWQGKIKPQKWKRSCVITDQWRLINDRELYDMFAVPDQSNDVAANHHEIVTQLRSATHRLRLDHPYWLATGYTVGEYSRSQRPCAKWLLAIAYRKNKY